MFTEPKPLPTDSAITAFTPDATRMWLAAYAGPCGLDGCTDDHVRLFLIPVIGWLHVILPSDRLILRPAIMSAEGVVSDYLTSGASFKFIAIVVDDEDAADKAKEIYRARFQGAPSVVDHPSMAIQN